MPVYALLCPSQHYRRAPHIYDQFSSICSTLEKHYRDMQDIEFTVEKAGFISCRRTKRTAQAAVKTAVDMVSEGICTREALFR